MKTLWLAMLISLGTASCARTDAPDEPVWGKQACAQCAMLVSDKRYAAQLLADGERRYFDDIGCLAAFVLEHAGHAEQAASTSKSWVRDAQSASWIEARLAHYASGAKTPMDYGYEARSDGTLSWPAVLDQVTRRNRQERRP